MRSYSYNLSSDGILAILLIYGIFFGILGIIWLIDYFFRGFGLYGIAKKQGYLSPWLAFIPFARTYLQGQLAAPLRLKNKALKNPGLWMVLLPIIFIAAVFVLYFAIFIITIIFIGASQYSANFSAIYPSFLIFGMALLLIVMAMAFQAILYTLTGFVNYRIHKYYMNTNMALVHMLLGLFVPFYQAVHFFFLRDKMPLHPGPAAEVIRPANSRPYPPQPPTQAAPPASPEKASAPTPLESTKKDVEPSGDSPTE